jgi:sodium/bile acid cotransporter 7
LSKLLSCRAFVLRQYLPLAFLVAFILAMAWPLPGQAVLSPAVMGVHVVTFVNTCMVFFISGLMLRTDELKQAFRRTAATGEGQQSLAASRFGRVFFGGGQDVALG